jgi:FtsP/CotA-like multicopper oxidase with cupredoxin domain
MRQLRFRDGLAFIVLVALLATVDATALHAQSKSKPATGKTRTYYIAADEVEWNYAPSGIDKMMGMPFMGLAKLYTERGPHRIGTVYRKAIYREYTDATFTHLKLRPPEEQYLGILGPILRAEVGDTIKVVFKNNATRPYSMHPHGVFYLKHSEGSNSDDGSSAEDKVGGAVPAGTIYTYVWEVPERAGPGPNDPSSLVWLYHSHGGELRDVNSGLIGAIIVTARGKAKPDGSPKNVDREFATLFQVFDENQSWYLDHNIETYTSDPQGTKKGEFILLDSEGRFSENPTGFVGVNFKFTINGELFGNLPVMTIKKGERVRWYLATLGFFFNFHTAHWHGNTVLLKGSRSDVVALSPAQMLTVDMVPDNPGLWLYHCHLSDHMDGGMVAFYRVEP